MNVADSSIQKFRQLTIRRALLLSFGLLLVLMLSICLAVWLFYDELEGDMGELTQQMLPQVVQLRKLVLANNNLTSVAGKIARADELNQLSRLSEFSQQLFQDLQNDLELSQQTLKDERKMVLLQQIHRQVEQNVQQLTAQVKQGLTVRKEVAAQHQAYLLLSDRLTKLFLAEAQHGQGAVPPGQNLFLEGIRLLGNISDLVSGIEHIDVSADIDMQESVAGQQLAAVEELFSVLQGTLKSPDVAAYPVLLKKLLTGETSLFLQRRQLLNSQARIEALMASSEQLNAQFRLLTTVMVKNASAQVDGVRFEVLEDIVGHKRFMILMILVSLLLSGGVIWVFGYRQLVRPLTGLSQSVASFGKGEQKGFTSKTGSIWEVQSLVRSFQEMSQAISRRDEDLRQLQLLLRNVIDSLTPLIIAVDQQGRTILWNLRAQNLCGDGLSKGTPIATFLSWLPLDFGLVEEAIRTRQPLHAKHLRVDMDGQSRTFELSCAPLQEEQHQGAVLRVDDVTERLLLEKALAQSEKMLSVGGLASGVAHEINNPLAGIMQNAQVLENRLSTTLPRNVSVAQECGVDMPGLENYLQQRGVPKLLQGIRSSANQAAKVVKNMLVFVPMLANHSFSIVALLQGLLAFIAFVRDEQPFPIGPFPKQN